MIEYDHRRADFLGHRCSIVGRDPTETGWQEELVSDRFFQSVAVFITARRTTTAPERRRDARYEGEERIVVTVESDSCEEVARSNEEKQAGQSPFL